MSGEVTLEAAYNELDPKPLTLGELDTLFVERPNTRTSRLVSELRLLRSPGKFLFIGHMASGKSTELQFVAKQLQASHVAVFVPLYQVFASGDLSHDELMYSIYSRIIRAAADDKYIKAGILTDAFKTYLQPEIDKFSQWLFGAERPDLSLDQLGAKIGEGFASVEIQVATDSSLRDKLKGKAGDLGRVINSVINQVETKTKKKLLLIVEDIDKYDTEATKKLFVEHTGTLLLPNATTIYTFPVAMKYADEFSRIEQSFKPYELPNIPVFKKDGSPDAEGQKALREIITRRAHEMLFTPDALKAIVMRGGYVRGMILLARDSVNNALASGKKNVDAQDVNEAFAEVCLFFQGMMTAKDYDELPKYRFAEIRKSDDLQRYLANMMALEYRNGQTWCNLHPAVDFILQRNEQRNGPAR